MGNKTCHQLFNHRKETKKQGHEPRPAPPSLHPSLFHRHLLFYFYFLYPLVHFSSFTLNTLFLRSDHRFLSPQLFTLNHFSSSSRSLFLIFPSSLLPFHPLSISLHPPLFFMPCSISPLILSHHPSLIHYSLLPLSFLP